MAEKTKHPSYCDGNVGEAIQMQSKAVFVGYNLPNWITKDLLIQHFHSFLDKLDLGRSTIIDAPGDRRGKVFFTDNCTVDQAIEQLKGRLLQWESRLDVNPCVSKRSRLQSEVFSQEGGKRKKYEFACESRIGPQYRESAPPFRPGPGEGMPFPLISSPSSGSHLKYTGLDSPPVPYSYSPGYLPGTISSHLSDAKEQSTAFLTDSIRDSQNVQIEPLLWTLITSRHMRTLEAEDCKVSYSKESPGVFKVSGKKEAVQSVVIKIKAIEADLKSKLCCETVEVDKCLQFSLDELSILSFVKSVEEKCFVKIDLPRSNTVMWEAKVKHSICTWSNQCLLQIVQGTLTKENTDAVVNSAQPNLKLLGGTSLALMKAGGNIIQEECDTYVDAHGKVPRGEAVCLGSGNLLCTKIIHAVPPKWHDGSKGEVALKRAYVRSLDVAIANNCRSVALPALGTGTLQCPMDKCAECALSALMDTLAKNPNRFEVIKFVLYSEADVFYFRTAFESLATTSTLNPLIILSWDKTGSSDVPDPTYQWEFMDDDGKFQPFEQKLGSQVENEYLRDPKSHFHFSRGKWSYSVNLNTIMTQTNMQTGKMRMIKRSMYIPNWYWEDDDGTYHPYSQADSIKIGQIQNGTIKNQVHIDGRYYKFDFDTNHQVDICTGQKRKIRPRNLTIQVNGCIEDVHVAKDKITEYFKNIEKEDTFQIPVEFFSKMKPLIADLCTPYSVKVSFRDSSENVSVTFHGWKEAVGLVKEQCMKELLNQMNEHMKITIKHPDEWEPDDNPFVMKKVLRTSQEFWKVLTRMKETMPNVTIKKLERIQNQWLWEKYAQHRTRIHKKNQGKIKEKDLFHGTSETDPSLIYNGEEGFDMRFGNGGTWGVGNYFAVNASYSHSYAHHVSGGMHQMFLARVITGESYYCERDPSLRMPPKKPWLDRNFAGERYDSVTGTTKRGSQVFIIYDNLKAYPLYLITYNKRISLIF